MLIENAVFSVVSGALGRRSFIPSFVFVATLAAAALPLCVAEAQDKSSTKPSAPAGGTAQNDRKSMVETLKDTTVAVVKGRVLDSLEKPLADAEVLLLDARGKTAYAVKSSKNGRFEVPSVKPGRYRLSARSLGYLNARSDMLTLVARDTVDVDFILDPNENTLAEVRVRAAGIIPQYRITAEEIAKKPDRDALSVILNRRIRMLGDSYKNCLPDTSTFTLDFRHIRKSPKYMGMDSSMPLRLFINGVWHGVRGIKDVLADIPAEDILEMNYVDCWDKTRPNLRNSLMVVLKPGRRY